MPCTCVSHPLRGCTGSKKTAGFNCRCALNPHTHIPVFTLKQSISWHCTDTIKNGVHLHKQRHEAICRALPLQPYAATYPSRACQHPLHSTAPHSCPPSLLTPNIGTTLSLIPCIRSKALPSTPGLG